MKTRYILLIVLLFLPGFVLAQDSDSCSTLEKRIEDIIYPVEELGNCKDKQECKLFCDKIANMQACYDFSEKYNLFSQCGSGNVKRFLNALKQVKLLPCETKAECLDFCSKAENFDQCLSFAAKTGVLPPERALLFKRTRGLGPGQCKDREDCKSYCSEENNVDECLAYAVEHGFISQAQVAEAIKVRDIALQGGPGGCVGLKQCRDYCSVSSNFNECISFGKEVGIITQKQADEMQEFSKKGGPGGCKTQQECNEYCKNPETAIACVGFMIDQGYLSDEQIKTMEQDLKESQEAMYKKIEEYAEQYGLDEEEKQEMLKKIEESMQFYKDILEKPSSSKPVRSIAQRIRRERGFLARTTKLIAQGIKNSAQKQAEPSNLADIFKGFFANIVQRLLNR